MPQQAVNPLLQFFPLITIMLIFYFLLIRPQQKSEKQRKEMLKNIKKNDEVVTAGGVHGVVVNVKDKTVSLRVDDNVKMEVDREAISRVERAA
ncbi:preprotein translocase subunit YajC [bacterium]|nr:MAG: preprotein translocase subunit YajC [bacterium]